MATSGSIRSKHSSLGQKLYMPGLDGLRAISVLAVIAYHLNLSWAPGGFLGVGVFFVLSGYLITDQLMVHWQDTQRLDLKDFWLRRFRRLMPGLFFMLGIVSLYLFLFDRALLISLKGDLLSAVLYFNNWWLIFHQVSYFESFGPPSPIGHLWSLAIEEQFYLLWPLILVLLLRFTSQRSKLVLFTIIGAAASVVAMALIYNVGSDPSRVYYGTDTRAFALLIGAAVAMVWPSRSLQKQIPSKPRLILDVAGAVGLLGIILIMWRTNEYDASLYLGGLALFSILTAVVTAVLAHPATLTGRVMGCKPLRWIGVRSYSLYLWHFPVIILTSPAVDTGELNIGRLVIQLTITTILAAASYKYIEEPIRRGSFTLRPERIRILTPLILRCAGVMVTVSLLLFVVSGPSNISKNHTYANAPGAVKGIKTGSSTPVENPPPQKIDSPEPDVSMPEEKLPEINSPDVGSEVKTDALITAIGDSVILGAEPYLKKIFPGIIIDGELGRQMNQAQDVVNRLKAAGKLGDCVIIELGSNGPFKPEEFHTLLASLGDVQQIIIVNTRVPKRWQDTVNSDLAKAAEEFQATLVDWYDASQGKDSYFYGDGVHLSPHGAECYASLISDAVKITTEP